MRSGTLKVLKKVNFRKLPDNGYLDFDELISDPIPIEIKKGHVEERLLQLDILE